MTNTQNTETYIIERVSDHGRTDHKGTRYGRRATALASTGDQDEAIALRTAARAALEVGSSEWIEIRTA